MPGVKDIEIGFRRFMMRVLRSAVKRGKPLPAGHDFGACKFLFVRQDRIGDVLVSTPLFVVLKERYPGARIDVLLSEKNRFVLDNEPVIHTRWVYTKRFVETLRLLRAIRRERYDFVVDLIDNPSTTSTMICAVAGGRWNVGLVKENDFVYDISVPMLPRSTTHIVDRIARLLTVFGIDPGKEQLRLRYTVSPASESLVDGFWAGNRLRGAFVVGLNISAGSDVRFWGAANFHDLIRRVAADHPSVRVLILYKPGERERAESIAQPFRGVLVAPETRSFDQFAAFVSRLSLLVTPDTSTVHLASVFQVPAVVLYVQSDRDLAIWSPYKSESELLVTHVDDLTTIPSATVHAAVERLLRKTALQKPAGHA